MAVMLGDSGGIAARGQATMAHDTDSDRDFDALSAVLSPKSAWRAPQAAAFLAECRLPLRLSTVDERGFPHITSLWFQYANGRFLCCTQRSAVVCRHLVRNARVGFEVAVCAPPYHGLSGQGEAAIVHFNAAPLLTTLIEHYLQGRDPPLRQWLLSRLATEVVIEIVPRRLTSWDFRRRMSS